MIAGFKNKALKRYWTKGDESGLRPDWRSRIRLVLFALEAASKPEDLDIVGLGFHALTGNLAGLYAVMVSRNWRITFEWDGENAAAVDLEDYHGR